MYREGRKALERGLSRGASVTLGLLTALICAGMAAMATYSNSPIGFFLFSLFSGAIAVACLFTGKLRHLAGRLVGAAVFVTSAWYLLGQVNGGAVLSGGRSEPSIFNALFFMAAAGIPGLLYALFGRFTRSQPGSKQGEP